MPVSKVGFDRQALTSTQRRTREHGPASRPQVITRTDGRALGVIAHLYVDPRALAVVSLSLRAKGLGGGAAGNMPLAALCQARW